MINFYQYNEIVYNFIIISSQFKLIYINIKSTFAIQYSEKKKKN